MSSVTPKLVVFNLNIGNPRHEQAMEDGKADRVSSMVNELAESLYGQCDRPFPCPKDDVRACVRACGAARRGGSGGIQTETETEIEDVAAEVESVLSCWSSIFISSNMVPHLILYVAQASSVSKSTWT